MAFDIASVLKNVSAPDTGAEQIEYLPIDSLLPDPNNFYLLDGLEELAANIELIGLQQPLRVRPAEDKGYYTIVSGHRRKAACMMIRDGGSDMFDRGVPCIVERGEASAALRELRLIYANSATRVMSAAELSKQAERVEMLLYTLKDEGMEFPGRMRDHVAEACKVSKTKLARLHAIRSRLDPMLLQFFDRGELSETSAYELQKLPAEAQKLIGERCEKRGSATWFYSWQVEEAAANTELYQNPKTGKACGGNCTHKDARFLQALRSSYNPCEGGCCLNCGRMDYCEEPCARAAEKRKKNRAEAKANQADEERKRAMALERQQEVYRAARQNQAARLLPLIEAAGLEDADTLPSYSWTEGPTIDKIRKYAAGDFGSETYYDDNLIKGDLPVYTKLADMLNCSLDYLAGRSDEPKAAVSGPDTEKAEEIQILSAAWQTGEPVDDGRYFCRVLIGEDERPHEQRMEWRAGGWRVFGDPADKYQMQVVAWWPLPPEVM